MAKFIIVFQSKHNNVNCIKKAFKNKRLFLKHCDTVETLTESNLLKLCNNQKSYNIILDYGFKYLKSAEHFYYFGKISAKNRLKVNNIILCLVAKI